MINLQSNCISEKEIQSGALIKSYEKSNTLKRYYKVASVEGP